MPDTGHSLLIHVSVQKVERFRWDLNIMHQVSQS